MSASGNSSFVALRRRFFSFSEEFKVSFEEYSVTAPEWARPGDSIDIEAGAQRYVVSVPHDSKKGELFTVAVPRMPRSASDLRRELSCPARTCCTCFSTCWIVLIWALVAANYMVLVLWRPERWSSGVLLGAFALGGLQLASYVRCQLTPPGTVTAEWQREAAAGREPAESCKRTGLLQPARGKFVAHEGKVVLALDHYCFWLGTTVGFDNRKFFLLFVWYSFWMCVFGGAVGLHELWVGLPSRLPADVLGSSYAQGLLRDGARARAAPPGGLLLPPSIGWLVDGAPLLLLRLASSTKVPSGALTHAMALVGTVTLDLAAALVLGSFSLWHTWLLLANRTTMQPDDTRYDVGVGANVRQVMGRNPLLWPLPVVGAGSSVDGMHWPLNPVFERAEREAALPEAAQDVHVHVHVPATKLDRDV